MKSIVEVYQIKTDLSEAEVTILKEDNSLYYQLKFPIFEPATMALIDEIRHELITELTFTENEVTDPDVIKNLKEKFVKRQRYY